MPKQHIGLQIQIRARGWELGPKHPFSQGCYGHHAG